MSKGTNLDKIIDDFVKMCLDEDFDGGWESVGDALSDTLLEFKEEVIKEHENKLRLVLEKADDLCSITERIVARDFGRYDENLYIQSKVLDEYKHERAKVKP